MRCLLFLEAGLLDDGSPCQTLGAGPELLLPRFPTIPHFGEVQSIIRSCSSPDFKAVGEGQCAEPFTAAPVFLQVHEQLARQLPKVGLEDFDVASLEI